MENLDFNLFEEVEVGSVDTSVIDDRLLEMLVGAGFDFDSYLDLEARLEDYRSHDEVYGDMFAYAMGL